MAVARRQQQNLDASTLPRREEAAGEDDDASSRHQQGSPPSLLRCCRHRRPRSAMRMRLPALLLLLLTGVSLMLSALPSCEAGKDKVVSTEPTIPPPPPVSAPALVPIPPGGEDADDYYDDKSDDDKKKDDDDDKNKDDDDKKKDDDSKGGVDDPRETLMPTSAPTPPPAGSGGSGNGGGGTYAVALPILGLDLVLAASGGGSAGRRRQRERRLANGAAAATGSDAASSPLDANVVDAALEGFLTTFLERSHRDTLQGVLLDTSVTSYDPDTGYARVAAADGTATFVEGGEEKVRASDLAETIGTYLSFWGVQDLVSAMHDRAGLDVLGLNVTLDGVPVEPQVQVVDAGGGGATNSNGNGTGNAGAGGSSTSGSSSSSTSKSKDNSTLIVVIAVLGTLAVFLLAGTLWIVMKRRNGRAQVQKHLGGISLDDDYRGNIGGDDDTQSYSPRPSSGRASPSRFRILGTASAGSKSNLSTPNGSPSRVSRAMSDDDFRSLSGVVSVEESIFTSNDAANSSSNNNNNNNTAVRSVGGDVIVVREPSSSHSYLQYDPSRLDHVIMSARGMSEPKRGAADPEANRPA